MRAERVVPARAGRAEVELVRLPAGKNRAAAVRQLEADPAVAYAEPNWTYTTQATATDPYVTDGRLWGIAGDASTPANQYGSQAAEAWARGNTGVSSVYVGVIDEGIQFNHPDSTPTSGRNPVDPVDGRDDDGNGYVDDVHGWDFANGDSSIYDGGNRGSLDDHGTHVSGTIGGEATTARASPASTWSTTLISGKFLGRNGGSLADAIKAVDYFTDLKKRHGLNIVATNNSWGGGGFSQALLDADQARQRGGHPVRRRGRQQRHEQRQRRRPTRRTTTSPNVIAVAAIDKTGALASFSQYGATHRRHRRARRRRLVDHRLQRLLAPTTARRWRRRTSPALRRCTPPRTRARRPRPDQERDPEQRRPDARRCPARPSTGGRLNASGF